MSSEVKKRIENIESQMPSAEQPEAKEEKWLVPARGDQDEPVVTEAKGSIPSDAKLGRGQGNIESKESKNVIQTEVDNAKALVDFLNEPKGHTDELNAMNEAANQYNQN